MTTGNLRGAFSSLIKALEGDSGGWPHAWLMVGTCLAFAAGALAGAWTTPRLAGRILWTAAAGVAVALAAVRPEPDPLPGWKDRT